MSKKERATAIEVFEDNCKDELFRWAAEEHLNIIEEYPNDKTLRDITNEQIDRQLIMGFIGLTMQGVRTKNDLPLLLLLSQLIPYDNGIPFQNQDSNKYVCVGNWTDLRKATITAQQVNEKGKYEWVDGHDFKTKTEYFTESIDRLTQAGYLIKTKLPGRSYAVFAITPKGFEKCHPFLDKIDKKQTLKILPRTLRRKDAFVDYLSALLRAL